jgi:hypothetical protein
MRNSIISLILLISFASPAIAADAGMVKDSAPDRYTVQKGDTLWSIAGRYLKEPFRWPELWKTNQEQLKNPHLIFPGDVLVLERDGKEVHLRKVALETVKLRPGIRSEPSSQGAISSIPPAVIEPFLSKPLVVGANELDAAPRIVATAESRVAVGAGDVAFAQGIKKTDGNQWQIFRRGDPIVDPASGTTLGYEAIYLGEASVRQHGDVATLAITKSVQEIYRDDRLIPLARQKPVFAYMPRKPEKPIKGHIVAAYGGLQETGPLAVVTLSKGSKDGLQVGHVLAIERSQTAYRYGQRTAPLFGRSGPSGDEAPRNYYSEVIVPRDQLLPKAELVTRDSIAKLPDERYGLVMVFRTFDRASFGVVMESSRPVAVADVVTTP